MDSRKRTKLAKWCLGALVYVLVTILLCRSPSGYLKDRGHDAADVFTATVGMGLGAKARVGPINVGAFNNYDLWGLRGGTIPRVMGHDANPYDLTLTVHSFEVCSSLNMDLAKQRNKCFVSRGKVALTLAYPPDQTFYEPVPKERILRRELIPYYTQVEVAAGLGGTVRLGVNPGELLDFIVGWTTPDMFNDDVFLKRQ